MIPFPLFGKSDSWKTESSASYTGDTAKAEISAKNSKDGSQHYTVEVNSRLATVNIHADIFDKQKGETCHYDVMEKINPDDAKAIYNGIKNVMADGSLRGDDIELQAQVTRALSATKDAAWKSSCTAR
jgi:Tfp pilus tip-associated adhesin PilY1